MRSISLLLSLILLTLAVAERSLPATITATEHVMAHKLSSPILTKDYGHLPLQFEQNVGQTDKRVKFLTHGAGSTLFLTSREAVLCLTRSPGGSHRFDPKDPLAFKRPDLGKRETSVLRMRAVGSNPDAAVAAIDELPGKVNYFVGNDPKKWHTNIATYQRVAYRDLYKDIDLVYYGSGSRLEYDFVVKPGGDPSKIALSFTGAKSMRVAATGDLILTLPGGDVTWRKAHCVPSRRQHAPIGTWQIRAGKQWAGAVRGRAARRFAPVGDRSSAGVQYIFGRDR